MVHPSDAKKKILDCPRCRLAMVAPLQMDAFIDQCKDCRGTFFDQGEMFAALGAKADPSYWDRPETGGVMRPGNLPCPRCHAAMLLQDVKKDELHVEIDRCSSCGGIWLDGGETNKIMAIGEKMAPVVEAEKKAYRAALDKMSDEDLSPPSLIYRFLSLFRRK